MCPMIRAAATPEPQRYSFKDYGEPLRIDPWDFGRFRLPGRKEVQMNWDQIEGSWKQVKGKAKEQWGRLTTSWIRRQDGANN